MVNPNDKKGVKIADIVEAITETFKKELISEAYWQSNDCASFKEFEEKVPFEEMVVNYFDMEVADEGSYNSFTGGMFDNIIKLLKIKGYKVSENYEDAPPVTASIKPKED